jgi:hypothetical protein
VTDEICKIYIARDLRFVGETPDETEEFEYLRLAPEQLESSIASGRIWDGMTIAAWAIARTKIAGTEKK